MVAKLIPQLLIAPHKVGLIHIYWKMGVSFTGLQTLGIIERAQVTNLQRFVGISYAIAKLKTEDGTARLNGRLWLQTCAS